MSGFSAHIPYCGLPPSPAGLVARWNLDPVLILALFAIAAAYALGARRADLTRRARALFAAGWAMATLALISPLCALSVSLFAARVGQHMILALLAAPLVAAGRPFEAFAALSPRRAAPVRPLGAQPTGTALIASGFFAGLIWYWHAPGPYAWTFGSTIVYWTMHVTVFGSALWLWSTLLVEPGASPVRSIAAGLIATVQMGLLGALITLSPHPMYAPHALTTMAWGISPLHDQQIGGVIMWGPGCLVFFGRALLDLSALLSEPVRSVRASGASAQ